MKRFLTLSFVVLFVHGCTLFGIRNYELLSYDILVDEGDFQIRQYNDFVAAVTETEGSYNENRKVAHNRLFDYISGYNVQSESIAMTAPVFQKSNGETIEMTAPVVQKKSENGWIMSFILPSTYSIDSAPKPLDSKVSIEQSKGKKVAVVTYNGSLTEEAINRNTERLIDWAAQKGLTIKYPAYSAGYDPPWTLPWLKRNEVLIDVF